MSISEQFDDAVLSGVIQDAVGGVKKEANALFSIIISFFERGCCYRVIAFQFSWYPGESLL